MPSASSDTHRRTFVQRIRDSKQLVSSLFCSTMVKATGRRSFDLEQASPSLLSQLADPSASLDETSDESSSSASESPGTMHSEDQAYSEDLYMRGRSNSCGGLRERTTSHTERDIEMQCMINSAHGNGPLSPPPRRRRGLASPFLSNGNRASKQPATSHGLARKVVDWIQSIRIGRQRDVPLVTGLDRVWLVSPGGARPTESCATAVQIAGIKPPAYLWYQISGGVCDVLQFALFYGLKYAGLTNASAIWCLGFCLSIPCRHTSHRYLVFGDYVGGYWRSLARLYGGYSVTIVLSTGFNMLMDHLVVGADMLLLWLITMVFSGVANYFVLKRFWSFGGSASSSFEKAQRNSCS